MTHHALESVVSEDAWMRIERKALPLEAARATPLWRVYEAWLERRAGIGQPALSIEATLELAEITGREGWVHVIDVDSDDPRNFKLTLHGSQARSWDKERDWRGKLLRDIPAANHALALQRDTLLSKSAGVTQFIEVLATVKSDQPYCGFVGKAHYQRLILPGSFHGRGIDRLVVATHRLFREHTARQETSMPPAPYRPGPGYRRAQ